MTYLYSDTAVGENNTALCFPSRQASIVLAVCYRRMKTIAQLSGSIVLGVSLRKKGVAGQLGVELSEESARTAPIRGSSAQSQPGCFSSDHGLGS